MTDSGVPGWLISVIAGMLSGLVTGFLSAFGSIAYFGGDTKATLEAHNHRLETLENDVRYEVRAIRDSIHAMRADFHVNMQEMRKEMLSLMKALVKSDAD